MVVLCCTHFKSLVQYQRRERVYNIEFGVDWHAGKGKALHDKVLALRPL